MACKRFGNSTSIKLLSNYTNLSKMTSTLTSMPQIRKISQTSAPSQSGLQQLSHINPELILRIEKQLAAQGTQIMCNVITPVSGSTEEVASLLDSINRKYVSQVSQSSLPPHLSHRDSVLKKWAVHWRINLWIPTGGPMPHRWMISGVFRTSA